MCRSMPSIYLCDFVAAQFRRNCVVCSLMLQVYGENAESAETDNG